MNVKGCGADVRLNDILEAPICSPDCCRLNTLLQFGDMALEMRCNKGKKIKQLSNDNAKSIHHTCYGTVELCKHLLASINDYVLRGMFFLVCFLNVQTNYRKIAYKSHITVVIFIYQERFF